MKKGDYWILCSMVAATPHISKTTAAFFAVLYLVFAGVSFYVEEKGYAART